MTKQQVIDAAVAVVEEMRWEDGLIPYKTGNLRQALDYTITGNTIDIYIRTADNNNGSNEDGSIAPYAPYTNEPWISPRWHGNQNPNEGWWQRFAAEFAKRLATKLRGELR